MLVLATRVHVTLSVSQSVSYFTVPPRAHPSTENSLPSRCQDVKSQVRSSRTNETNYVNDPPTPTPADFTDKYLHVNLDA